MNNVVIIFGERKFQTQAADGELLGEVITSLDLPLEQPCAGRGTCGRCKVLLEKGAADPDEIEQEHLTAGDLALGTRLACRARVKGDTQVMLSPIVVYSNKIFKASSRYKRDRDVPLGLAIDLGSTTVAAYLTMLDNGEVVAGGASMNQQRVYGADIISRISAAVRSEEHRQRLHRLAVSSINQAINSLNLSSKILERVTRVTVVGNVAMHHLLAKLPVNTIAVLPFQPYTKDSSRDAADLLDGILPASAQVMLPPMIGGFVGSDALACLAYFGYDQPEGPMLAVDLGTNGEVLVTDGKQILAASTAAGPAFEGVNISCGMRAVDGAIVDARLEGDEFVFETIGDQPPIGITGSGLMKIIDELVKVGVIDPSGKILDQPPMFGAHLELDGKVKRILLTSDRLVWLTQKDIREFQKAKGAIRAAIEVLLQHAGLTSADLEKVILTGSFGGQLDVGAVIDLGMIPNVAREVVHNIASGAGMGAAMFLSDEGFVLGEKLARETEQVDLDQHSDFHKLFIDCLALKAM